jgi:hypothetical protein
MSSNSPKDRQEFLRHLLTQAITDNNILEALEAYQMGLEEYERAVASLVTIQISTGNASNPEYIHGEHNANLDRN